MSPIRLSITLRIWLTVAAIVLIFTTLLLYIVPSQQEKYFIETFNNEVDNLAKTVALGTKIALNEQNFEGVQVAMDFAKSDSRLKYVAVVEIDTLWNSDRTKFEVDKTAFLTYPKGYEIDLNLSKSDSLIAKVAPFTSRMMVGEIMVGFKTDEIVENMNRIRMVAIIVSLIVFAFGIMLGLWLANTISKPVRAIRDAAIKVGQGDLTQKVGNKSKDEIGDLSRAFNKMVGDLSEAEDKIREKNQTLMTTLGDLELKNDLLSIEKKKSDKLLLNILPEETAEELKKYGHSKPKFFENVTVMFIDFAHFTQISEKLSPVELVEEIDFCFQAFDGIVQNNGLEKIKTIGDAYLCVGGLPTSSTDHAERCVKTAFEIQAFLMDYKSVRVAEDKPFFEARIGIHTGPLVAGIVGSSKFAYDIWGDTVNTASRMESCGEVQKVNVSHNTFLFIPKITNYEFESRGKVAAKGKGDMEMYFVTEKENIPTS